MKKRFLLKNKFFAAWLFFHLVCIIPFFVLLFKSGSVTMDADLFNMLPKPVVGKAMGIADKKLTELTGQNLFILVSNKNFSEAKRIAKFVYEKLKTNDGFASLSFYVDENAMSEVMQFAEKFSCNLLQDATVKNLSTKVGAERFAEDALSKAYGAFSFSSSGNLERDPFMLSDVVISSMLSTLQKSGTSFSVRDDVLASENGGLSYIMIRGVLTEKGAAIAAKKNAVTAIYDVCMPLEKDGTRFVFSGTPFHSHKSSTEASREVAIISAVSMMIIVVLFLLVFQNPLPLASSVVSVLLSIASAFCATYTIFGKMNLLTLVFGTSLIGSCIDYSLHFFIHWKGNCRLESGKAIRSHLFTGLLLSLVSTELCYFALVFAPFGMLRQMAVFSLIGIASAFLTVIAVYPAFPLPAEMHRSLSFVKFYRAPHWYTPKTGNAFLVLLFTVLIALLLFNRKNIRIQNDVTRLYKLEGRVLEDEKKANELLSYSPRGWFIISGKSAEETLETEEWLCEHLNALSKKQNDFLATTNFIPSIAKQKKSRAAFENLLPLAETQYEMLGFDASFAKTLRKRFYADEQFISIEENVPRALSDAISTTWFGKIDDNYYSIVMPITFENEAAFKELADEKSNIYFENKMQAIGTDLDTLTKTILKLFALAYIPIVIMLKFFYNMKQTVKIAFVPILIVLSITAVFAAANIALEFFSITGMILVFGLGLDYIIYMAENKKRKTARSDLPLEPFAIALSFATTAVSFGALALSSFAPVHMLGLSIFLGLTTAFIATAANG